MRLRHILAVPDAVRADCGTRHYRSIGDSLIVGMSYYDVVAPVCVSVTSLAFLCGEVDALNATLAGVHADAGIRAADVAGSSRTTTWWQRPGICAAGRGSASPTVRIFTRTRPVTT
jgi:hypothetical protein